MTRIWNLDVDDRPETAEHSVAEDGVTLGALLVVAIVAGWHLVSASLGPSLVDVPMAIAIAVLLSRRPGRTL